MSSNSFGRFFRFTTWGESHGKAIGCVIDGVPPNIEITEEYIQFFLDKRKPGQSKFTTQRKESDLVSILSGVFENKTTGTPISLIIYNQDQRSRDYSEIKDKFRPGHADYTYFKKYGIRDYRGGGRSSARETAMRVAAGAIARKVLGDTISIRGALIQIGNKKINRDNWDWNEVNNNDLFCPDKESVESWENYVLGVKKEGVSLGAVIEVVAEGVPAGLGAPVYNKLDADIASALMGINAVKSVEIGLGTRALEDTASDQMYIGKDNKVCFKTNYAGGILGGISNGEPIVSRFTVKPTSSILKPQKTIDIFNEETEVVTKGRHDPCVGIRGVPVGEAMVACVLADNLLQHRAQTSDWLG